MFHVQKSLAKLALIFAIASGLLNQSTVARADGGDGVSCVMDVVVETRNQTGTVVSQEVYQKAFVLQEGQSFFDDFSTRTRFKFFNASLQKENGDKTVAINWFADVTVFNSVDFDTSVTLSDGQKSGKATGRHTLYTSTSSTTTTYSLVCVGN